MSNQPHSNVAPPSADERLIAAGAYLVPFVGVWIFGPIAFLWWKRRQSPFVAFHAAQSILLQLMLAPFLIVGLLVWMVVTVLAQNEILTFGLMVVGGLFGLLITFSPAFAALRVLLGRPTELPLIRTLARRIANAAAGNDPN